MRLPVSTLCLVALPFAACTPEEIEPEETTLFGAVTITEIATSTDGLNGPRDLDFNPEVEGELWVQNRIDDATLTIRKVGTADQTILRRKDPYALHFMEETAAISFSTGNKFGSCGETRNTYDGTEPFNDFMGPALWSSADDVFAISNPEAVAEHGDLGSHLDMMHETPLCMGIAWVSDNIYYVFEGLEITEEEALTFPENNRPRPRQMGISRYDFKSDHGPGFDDHDDGTVERFMDTDVKRVADVPSHLVYDHDSELLYVADTGNARIQVLDTSRTIALSQFAGTETMVQELDGAKWTTFLGEEAELQLPSGIALKDGVLYVGDNLTSTVNAYDLEGNLIDTLELDIAEGGLMGMRVSPDGGSLYVVDFIGNRVLRVEGLAVLP